MFSWWLQILKTERTIPFFFGFFTLKPHYSVRPALNPTCKSFDLGIASPKSRFLRESPENYAAFHSVPSSSNRHFH